MFYTKKCGIVRQLPIVKVEVTPVVTIMPRVAIKLAFVRRDGVVIRRFFDRGVSNQQRPTYPQQQARCG